MKENIPIAGNGIISTGKIPELSGLHFLLGRFASGSSASINSASSSQSNTFPAAHSHTSLSVISLMSFGGFFLPSPRVRFFLLTIAFSLPFPMRISSAFSKLSAHNHYGFFSDTSEQFRFLLNSELSES